MPTFSAAAGSDGPIIRVEVGVSRSHRQKLFAARSAVPQPLTLTALIDTGAEITCVDPRVARRLQLTPYTSYAPLNAPGLFGLTLSDTYEVGLAVLHPSGDRADHLIVEWLEVAEVPLGIFRIDVLLGRDVLALCDFNYLGRSGTFVLSY
jgi:hypothetical protein